MRGFDEIADAVEKIAETVEPNKGIDATAAAKETEVTEETEEAGDIEEEKESEVE